MTNLQLPAHILAWKVSSEVVRMEEVLASDPRRTEEEDRLPKVTCYWRAHDQEVEKAKEKELENVKGKGKEKEKEKEKEAGPSRSVKGKEKETWPSRNVKGKAKEVPMTPKKSTPKKVVHLLSQEEDPLHSPERQEEAIRELTKLEWRRSASFLEKSWYDMDICALNLEQMVDQDLMEADSKVLTLMDMKSRGVEISPAVEKRILANRSSIIASYTTHMERIFMHMNLIQKHTAWTKNELPDSTLGFGNQEAGPSDHTEDAGNKRKAEESEDHVEGKRYSGRKM
ncbi:hypothetical protein M422DRAFT_259593 [Sphaerobolus stellatus SS14]|uniref:Uncharacterized protein n=1 Tax=Sphaerobolus stellatus (strain SS14) TaxID=990650 RepID=A0A0C9VJE6_SPHS4|nr:hypothetical protein M422DRAFT_259593 [Sphaerobolus stellatus SS14]